MRPDFDEILDTLAEGVDSLIILCLLLFTSLISILFLILVVFLFWKIPVIPVTIIGILGICYILGWLEKRAIRVSATIAEKTLAPKEDGSGDTTSKRPPLNETDLL